jgi:hypothetical protein
MVQGGTAMTACNDGNSLMSSVNFSVKWVLLVAVLLLASGLAQAQRTLTIQNANGQTAGVIELSNTAQVDFRVTTTGITLGLPVGVSFTCQGTTSANGSCDATAGATGTGGGGGGVTDADSDGVADSSDQCANTPAGEFANSVGCSPSQLDDDSDGVSNAVDQCANTATGASVDATGCPVTTTTPPTTTPPTTNTGAYCSGTPAGVTCSAANNMDKWWEYSGEVKQVLDGSVLSLPFSTRASTRDGGQVGLTTYEGAFINGESFRAWISDTPGGKPLRSDSDCNIYMAQARGGMYWTQNAKYANNTRFCYLGQAERTLYLNFEACTHDASGLSCAGPRASGYNFDVRRSYRAY